MASQQFHGMLGRLAYDLQKSHLNLPFQLGLINIQDKMFVHTFFDNMFVNGNEKLQLLNTQNAMAYNMPG